MNKDLYKTNKYSHNQYPLFAYFDFIQFRYVLIGVQFYHSVYPRFYIVVFQLLISFVVLIVFISSCVIIVFLF